MYTSVLAHLVRHSVHSLNGDEAVNLPAVLVHTHISFTHPEFSSFPTSHFQRYTSALEHLVRRTTHSLNKGMRKRRFRLQGLGFGLEGLGLVHAHLVGHTMHSLNKGMRKRRF
jgi:hypothetical protein